MKKNKIILSIALAFCVLSLGLTMIKPPIKKASAMGGFEESYYHGVIPFSRVYYYPDNSGGGATQLTFTNAIPAYAQPELLMFNGLRVRQSLSSYNDLTTVISFDSYQPAVNEDSMLFVETSNPFIIEFSDGKPFVNLSFISSGFTVSSAVTYQVGGSNELVNFYNSFNINDNTATNFIDYIFPSSVYNVENDVLVYDCSLRFRGYMVDTYLNTPITIKQETYVNLGGYAFGEFVPTIVYDNVNLFESLINSVNSFLQIEILPDLSFMDLLVLVLVIPLLIMILKVWLGG